MKEFKWVSRIMRYSVAMSFEQIADRDEIVCFLIVNYIPFLPSLSIGSCLSVTDCSIVVAYINEEDIRDLPTSPRITRLNLKQIPRCSDILLKVDSGAYKQFGSPEFFNLVQLKWHLFAELLNANFQRIIYSDIDTVWLQDAVTLTRLKSTSSLLQIQDVTIDIRTPKLCMGFVSMINNQKIVEMIEDCANENDRRLLSGELIGDDDIITDYFNHNGNPTWIQPLPQLAFPTGNMLTQYLAKSSFRPVKPPRPILFHANYIIGQKNKAIVLEKIYRRMKVQMIDELSVYSRFTLRIEFLFYCLRFWYFRFGRVFRKVSNSLLQKRVN